MPDNAPRSSNVVWQKRELDRSQRWAALGHGGATVWMTGLPASGKSTVAAGVEARAVAGGRGAYLLHGDNLPRGPRAAGTPVPGGPRGDVLGGVRAARSEGPLRAGAGGGAAAPDRGRRSV